MTKLAFINNDFVNEDKAALHLKDLSIQRGYGVFDFFRMVENEPLFLDDHLDRFHFSAEGLHLPIALSRQEIKRIVEEIITKNNLPGTGIRLTLTGGYSADGFTLARPNFMVSQHLFTPPAKEQIEKGIKILSYPHQRQLSSFKTIDYLMAVWLQPLLKEKGYDDILYHQQGTITECPRSNFFLVTKGDVLVTPATNVLAGITRKKILDLTNKGLIVEERPIHLNEIKEAKAAFITSTTKQILPVAQIDDVVLPQRKMLLELLQLFQRRYSC
jgi:D-alanine transaminase/branched-chain amino acid aminotransferase